MAFNERSQMPDHPPFVLVHGGRHGGWCWSRVATPLREAGHAVYTPTLTGLGERAHLLRPDIGLDTHAADLIGVMEFEELDDVVLVAHSYGGVVAAMAMERIADRVRHVVFLDAILPVAGESVMQLIGPELASGVSDAVEQHGEGWFLPPGDAAFYGVEDELDRAWVNSKMTPQPFKTYTDPAGTTQRAWQDPGTFVECRPTTITPEVRARARERSLVDERFEYRRLDVPHDGMVVAPLAVAELLLEIAGGSRPERSSSLLAQEERA
jgi:pimeloyl-ACP methyl ester carboxylesterase